MKKKITKALSVFMALALLLSATVTTASAAPVTGKKTIEEQVNEEIAQQKTIIFAQIRQQLEEQDAISLMDDFIDVVTPDIENSVRAKYNLPITKASPGNLVMDRGGVMSYETRLHATVVKTCLLPSQAKKYLVPNKLLTIGKVINSILGSALPHWGGSVGALLNLKFYLTDSNNKLIKSGKHIMCTQIKTAYESGTTFYAWDNFPMVAIPDAADRNNYHVKYFAK